MMLVLSTLHGLLSQILTPQKLHTVVLLTPPGELVSSASQPPRPKDDVRIIVGLASEVWRETREQGIGMVESELGRILVLPVDNSQGSADPARFVYRPPLLLLALNSADDVDWTELQTKGKVLASHLAKSVCQFRDALLSSNINGS